MADREYAFFVKRGRALPKGGLLPAVEEELKTVLAGTSTPLKFTVRPLAVGEELSTVLDRLSKATETNCCNGTCD